VSREFDPISFYLVKPPKSACTTIKAQTSAGTATYRLTSHGFTLMGLPTIVAQVTVGASSGDPGQLDARLWDVFAGRQRLFSRTDYRLSGHGRQRIVLQLHGNGYRFARGHVVKLELTGQDFPYYRASIDGPSITIHTLTMVMPTHQRPDGAQIRSPLSAPLPAPGRSGLWTTQGVRVGGR
jgi:hypothetical protein